MVRIENVCEQIVFFVFFAPSLSSTYSFFSPIHRKRIMKIFAFGYLQIDLMNCKEAAFVHWWNEKLAQWRSHKHMHVLHYKIINTFMISITIHLMVRRWVVLLSYHFECMTMYITMVNVCAFNVSTLVFFYHFWPFFCWPLCKCRFSLSLSTAYFWVWKVKMQTSIH